jgi:hypothetical protein
VRSRGQNPCQATTASMSQQPDSSLLALEQVSLTTMVTKMVEMTVVMLVLMVKMVSSIGLIKPQGAKQLPDTDKEMGLGSMLFLALVLS